jgi:hypothetical protein
VGAGRERERGAATATELFVKLELDAGDLAR